jgi:hypothetical protein
MDQLLLGAVEDGCGSTFETSLPAKNVCSEFKARTDMP